MTPPCGRLTRRLPLAAMLIGGAARADWEPPSIAYGDWPGEDGSRLIVEPFTVREVSYNVPAGGGTQACYTVAVWELPPVRAGVDEIRVEVYLAGESHGGMITLRPESEDPGWLRPDLLGPLTVTQWTGGQDVTTEVLPATGNYHGLIHSHQGDPIRCEDPRPWFDAGEYFPVAQVIWNRPGVDLVVTAHGEITEVSDDEHEVTYTVIVSNGGTEDARGATIGITVPDAVVWRSASATCEVDQRIEHGLPGGVATCSGLFVPMQDATTFTITGRVTNLSDAQAVPLVVHANTDGSVEESNYENNTYRASLTPTFDVGSPDDTRAAGAAFFESFNMHSAMFQSVLDDAGGDFACTTYAAEIFQRTRDMHLRDPSLFERLAYGRITTAPRDPGQGSSGHDGVVFYEKGTDYQESGVVIHGTAGPSRYGIGTTFTGTYNDTDIWYFQRVARQEASTLGRGFEGAYPDDAPITDDPPMTCPLPPGALGVTTGSPIDVHLTSSSGERLETHGGEIAVQGLHERVQTYSFAEEDGSFAWTMFVPMDTYEVEIVGNGDGPYHLTFTAWDDAGEPVEVVHTGVASVGSSETFTLARDEVLAGPKGSPTVDDKACGCSSTGSGAVGPLAALLLLAGGRRGGRAAREPRTS